MTKQAIKKNASQFNLRVLLRLLKAKDPNEALIQLLRIAVDKIGAEGGTFYSYKNHLLSPIYVLNQVIGMVWEPIKNSDSIKSKAIHVPTEPNYFCVKATQKRDVIIENNIQKKIYSKNYKSLFFDSKIDYKVNSLLTIPIFYQHKLLGVFQLINAIETQTRESRDFTNDDVEQAYVINEIVATHLMTIYKNTLQKQDTKPYLNYFIPFCLLIIIFLAIILSL